MESVGQAYWHIHHQVLLEFASEPIENRIEYIKTQKPERERETRLRLLKPVQGALPPAITKAWAASAKARAAYDQAWAAITKARAAITKAWAASAKARAAYDQAWAAITKAGAAYDKAMAAYAKAWAAYDKALMKHDSEIEALHALECPGCPWDGHTIFPQVKTK